MRTITIKSMPTVLFTGDSMSCGRNGAIDFPQLLSRRLPVRIINTAVGGSTSDALVKPMRSKKVRIRQGDTILYVEGGRWGCGPYPGMSVCVNGQSNVIDFIDERRSKKELHLCKPALEDYEGDDCEIEPGWDIRVARYHPDVVCLLFLNDGNITGKMHKNWVEMLRTSLKYKAPNIPPLAQRCPCGFQFPVHLRRNVQGEHGESKEHRSMRNMPLDADHPKS